MKKRPIYLNNAATSWPKPPSVIKAALDCMKSPGAGGGRGTFEGVGEHPNSTREALAGHFKTKNPERFVFTSNATEALNTLIHGFAAVQKGRFHVVTTALEHNSVLRPLNTLRLRGKIELTVVPFDERGYVRPSDMRDALREDTKLAVMNHGSNVLGTVQDIGRIGGIMAGRGVFFAVDAAQTVGHVNIDLSRLKADALAYTGHKSMFSLPGIGGFYIKDPSRVEPYKQGGTGTRSKHPYQPDDMPGRFEAGTLNYPGIASLRAGIGYVEKTGLKRIGKKTMGLTRDIIRALSAEENVAVYNRKPDLPIIAFNIGGLDNSDVGYILLNRHGIISRTGLHCAPLVHERIDGGIGCVRLSLSYMNTKTECAAAAAAAVRIARSAGKR